MLILRFIFILVNFNIIAKLYNMMLRFLIIQRSEISFMDSAFNSPIRLNGIVGRHVFVIFGTPLAVGRHVSQVT